MVSRIISFAMCCVVLWGCGSSEKQAELLYQQGMRDKTHGQYQQAVQRFQAAVMHNPQHSNAQTELGMLLCRYGKYADGIKHLLKARELTPHAFQPVSYLGYAYHQRGNWMLAETYYKLAIQLAPNLVDVRQYLVDVFEAQGKWDQATQILQDLLKDYPNYERAAIIRARIATLRSPGDSEAYRQLADAHVRYGEVKQGLKAYGQASLLPADAPERLARFGVFCAERKQFKAAITYFEQALNDGWNNDAELWWWLAESQDALGNTSAAIEAYQNALHYQPNYPGIQQRLADVLEEAGRDAEAADMLERSFYAGYVTDTNVVWSHILRLRGESSEKAVVQLTSAGSDEFLVDVVVDDGFPVTFLLDPQSEYTIISEELAQRLNIVLSANTSVVHFLYRGQRYTPYLINMPVIRIGELAVRNVKTLILDLSDVTPPIDGVLGKNFLKHFDVHIEGEHHLFMLTKSYS